ncbi:MAG: hypothetical protein ACTSYA_10075 [Candidatus Kariarchaeaceae archaeon]
MNRKLQLFISLAIVSLFLSSISVNGVVGLEGIDGKTITIDTTFGAYHTDFDYITANMTSYGATVTLLNETFSIEDDPDALLIAEPDLAFNESAADIVSWFEKGAKVLWVSSDSDYAGLYLPTAANDLLELLGAHVRIAAESFEDQESSDDSAYRLIANETGTSVAAVEITAGVNQVVFHGPTAIIGYDDGLVDLRTTDIENVDVIMSTSAAAYPLDSDLSATIYDFYSGITTLNGTYPILVMEEIGGSFLIVSGESTFADYKNMYGLISEKGRPTEGATLVDQLLNYAFENGSVDEAPSFTLVASIVGLGLMAVLVRRRR